MSGNVGDLLPVVWPPSKGEVIDGAIHQVTFYRALNDAQFNHRELYMLDIVGYWDGKWVGGGGEVA